MTLWNEQGIVNEAVEWVGSEERIDMAALQARDPILFFDEVIKLGRLVALNMVRKDIKWLTVDILMHGLVYSKFII